MNRLEERVADQRSIAQTLARLYVEENRPYLTHPAWRDMADFEQEYITDAMQRAISALESQGRKIVPVEPTEAMVEAGWFQVSVDHPAQSDLPRGTESEVYAAMLNAVEG